MQNGLPDSHECSNRDQFDRVYSFKKNIVAVLSIFVWHCDKGAEILVFTGVRHLHLRCFQDSFKPFSNRFWDKSFFYFIQVLQVSINVSCLYLYLCAEVGFMQEFG